MSYNILQSYRCLLKPTGGCAATAAVVNISTKEGRGEPLPRLGSLATLVFGICVPGVSNPIVSGFVIPNPIYFYLHESKVKLKRTHSKQEGREGGSGNQKDSYDEPEPAEKLQGARFETAKQAKDMI